MSRGRVAHPPAVYVVRWGDLWKAGYTTQRRWRSFLTRGAELVNVTFYDTATAALDAEELVDWWLRHLGHRAFDRKADAIPFLGNQGAGWVECLCLCSPDRSPHLIAPPVAEGSLHRVVGPIRRDVTGLHEEPLTLRRNLTLSNAHASRTPSR